MTRGRWIASTAGAAVLGAVSNGLWDFGLKRLFYWSFDKLLLVANLGFSSMRDRVYTDAAIGYREVPGLLLLFLVPSVLVVWTASLLLRYYRLMTNGPAPSTETARERAAKHARQKKWIPVIVLGLVVLTSAVMVQVISVSYTNYVIAHFNRSLAICGPVLRPEQERELRARFAQMRTKKDYLEIAASIQAIARTHQLDVPEL